MFKGILALLICTIAFSHPHSFIDSQAELCFNDEGIEGITTTWYFDEMFSSIVPEAFKIQIKRL